MRNLFRILFVLVTFPLAGCGVGALGDFIATDWYDVSLAANGGDSFQVRISGGRAKVYEVTLYPGKPIDVRIKAETTYDSGPSVGGTNYKVADIRVTAVNLRTNETFGPQPGQLHSPGVTGIRVGSWGLQIAEAPPDPNKTFVAVEDPNQ